MAGNWHNLREAASRGRFMPTDRERRPKAPLDPCKRLPSHSPIVPDGADRCAARERLRREHQRLAIAAAAHQLMDLGAYYAQPRGCFRCVILEGEGWAA